MMRRRECLCSVALLLLVSACAEFPNGNAPQPARGGDHGPDHPVDVSQVQDAVPGDDTPSRYGNPSTYTVLGKSYTLLPACKGYHDRGIASWYGMQFHGGRTSDGETYDMYAMTAANKVVPIPCWAKVTNLKNGKSVIVKINDRGPFVENRLIDLSYAAASKLDMLGSGTALVDVQAVSAGELPPPTATAAPAVAAAAPVPPVATAPAAFPAPAGSPQLFIQVGAFAERANAETAVAKLAGAGVQPAFILPVSDGTRTLYKVRIGPLADVDAVDRLTGKLASIGFTNSQIVIP